MASDISDISLPSSVDPSLPSSQSDDSEMMALEVRSAFSEPVELPLDENDLGVVLPPDIGLDEPISDDDGGEHAGCVCVVSDLVPSPGDAMALTGRHDVAEYYSPPRVLPIARAKGRSGSLSLDLNVGWDFRSKHLRDLSLRLLTVLQIKLLILSPPCTIFSELQRLWNKKKMLPHVWDERWAEGKLYLSHSMHCARRQCDEGRKFVFEHPERASSWKEEAVEALQNLPGVQLVVVDLCMLGLRSKVSGIPMRKRTKFMTNCCKIAQRFASVGLCDRTHEHEVIQGSEGGVRRSAWAQCYPAPLCDILADSV